MKKVLYYVVVVLLHSPSSCQAIIAFNSRRKSKGYLLSFIWWCWKAVWKTPQHFSPVLTPHKWGNCYNCLFFLPRTLNTVLRVKALVPDQGKQKQQSAQQSVCGTGRPCLCPYLGTHYFVKDFFMQRKRPTAPRSPETWVKHSKLSAHYVHRLHKGMPILICD